MMVTGTPAGAKSKLSQMQCRELTFKQSKTTVYMLLLSYKSLLYTFFFLLVFIPL